MQVQVRIPVSGRGPFCARPYPATATQSHLPRIQFTRLQRLTPSLSRAAFQKTVHRTMDLIALESIKENLPGVAG